MFLYFIKLIHNWAHSDKLRCYVLSPRATPKKWLRESEKLKEGMCCTRKYSLHTKESRKGGTEGENAMRHIENKKQNGRYKCNCVTGTLKENA